MAKLNLTDRAIGAAKAPANGRLELWDTKSPGLCLRVSSSGKVWVYRYRTPDGRQPRLKLGEHSQAFGLADARAKADKLRVEVREGGDPASDRRTARRAAAGWALENSSALGFDAVDGAGARYQIKSRRLTGRIGERQLSALRRIPEKSFDYLAAVLFDANYGVARAIILPHAAVEAGARFRSHTNAWLFILDDKAWELPGARDITADLVAAAERL